MITHDKALPVHVEGEGVLSGSDHFEAHRRAAIVGDNRARQKQAAVIAVDHHLPPIGPGFAGVGSGPPDQLVVVVA